jgi:hypothetical protein
MLGKFGHPFCGSKCCGNFGAGHKHTRRMKKAERQHARRDIERDATFRESDPA